jgi:hypothetical protein
MVLFYEIDIPTLLSTSAHDLTKDLFAPVHSQVGRYNCVPLLYFANIFFQFDFVFGSEE